jgi:hypothetical protein
MKMNWLTFFVFARAVLWLAAVLAWHRAIDNVGAQPTRCSRWSSALPNFFTAHQSIQFSRESKSTFLLSFEDQNEGRCNETSSDGNGANGNGGACNDGAASDNDGRANKYGASLHCEALCLLTLRACMQTQKAAVPVADAANLAASVRIDVRLASLPNRAATPAPLSSAARHAARHVSANNKRKKKSENISQTKRADSDRKKQQQQRQHTDIHLSFEHGRRNSSTAGSVA